METKPIVYGLIGLLLGGLIVSVATTKLSKPVTSSGEVTMSDMTASLRDKSGDDFDATFITHMIEHHKGAVEMAKLSADRAKHDEIKQMSNEIIKAQEAEITLMEQWQRDWGYQTGEHSQH